MSERNILNNILDFKKTEKRESAFETFYPWDLSVNRWIKEGLPEIYSSQKLFPGCENKINRYFNDLMTDKVCEYEKYLGYNAVKRLSFRIPYQSFEEKILEENDEYILKQDDDGWNRKYYKNSDMVLEIKPVVTNWDEWEKLKSQVLEELDLYCTDENLDNIYGKYVSGHKNGDYSIRFRISGFFWTPRILLGIEEHLIAFYDEPELIHDINSFTLQIYKKYLSKIFEILPADVILIEEDLSGKNGPMISPALFDEFVGNYYKEFCPFLKSMGVKNIFVDTDGDFNILIKNFIETGVDGFLPMDVNAGMDIVAVREKYSKLKFIGGFNKLEIAKGKEAIENEFKRILPVIKSGGYLPGADHQVAPSTSFENYKFYIKKLKEYMMCSGESL